MKAMEVAAFGKISIAESRSDSTTGMMPAFDTTNSNMIPGILYHAISSDP